MMVTTIKAMHAVRENSQGDNTLTSRHHTNITPTSHQPGAVRHVVSQRNVNVMGRIAGLQLTHTGLQGSKPCTLVEAGGGCERAIR